jgi:hypothetical protein
MLKYVYICRDSFGVPKLFVIDYEQSNKQAEITPIEPVRVIPERDVEISN